MEQCTQRQPPPKPPTQSQRSGRLRECPRFQAKKSDHLRQGCRFFCSPQAYTSLAPQALHRVGQRSLDSLETNRREGNQQGQHTRERE